jgi:bacteriocin-like protein
MTTENTDETRAPEVSTDEQDTAPVATSDELNKSELEEVSGGLRMQ